MLLNNRERLIRYLQSILIGVPTWLVIGILVTFSKEFAREFGIAEEIDPGKSIMFAYAGLAVGDVTIGLVSQWLKSRKRPCMFLCHHCVIYGVVLYPPVERECFHDVLSLRRPGLWVGVLGHFVTIGAEQFGTNLRATAATTIPNMVRNRAADANAFSVFEKLTWSRVY